MTKNVQEIAPQILEKVKNAKHVLLHCHPSPDPDSVGSALAMKFAIESLGKKATVIRGDSEIPQAFEKFPGIGDIVAKNYFEIDLSDFDLFIIQDSGSLDMISRKGEMHFPENLETIVIDHHVSNLKFAKLNLVDAAYPATCQILFDLFSEWGIAMNRNIAANLIVGMFTDTGGFKYASTTSDTFVAAAVCAKVAPDYTDIIFTMENSNTPQSILFRGLALNSIETFLSGHVAFASVTQKDIVSKGVRREDMQTGAISSILKSVKGWDVGICAIEEEVGKFKLSFRTRDPEKFNVSEIAVALGGGGHKAAAGAVIEGTLEEVKEKVIAVLVK